MIINIDDILEYVFDNYFEKNKPELAKKIREEEMYKILVEEIKILKEKHQTLEKVKEELRRETSKTRSHITKIFTNKPNGRLL